jgi:hypothetical protein
VAIGFNSEAAADPCGSSELNPAAASSEACEEANVVLSTSVCRSPGDADEVEAAFVIGRSRTVGGIVELIEVCSADGTADAVECIIFFEDNGNCNEEVKAVVCILLSGIRFTKGYQNFLFCIDCF